MENSQEVCILFHALNTFLTVAQRILAFAETRPCSGPTSPLLVFLAFFVVDCTTRLGLQLRDFNRELGACSSWLVFLKISSVLYLVGLTCDLV